MLVLLTFIFSLCLAFASTQALYNHNSASYVNQTWMTNLDDGIPIRQMTILGTHSSMSQGTWGDAFQTQASSITTQLNSGVRALDIRCNHKNNKLYAYERMINLNTELSGVLSQVGSFLARFPGQTVLVHIIEEYNPSGNSQTFEQSYMKYQSSFSSLLWNCTTQNPSLGMVRGKVVIIQNFAGAVHGLLYGSFTTIEHKQYSTNWDQYNRWVDIKNYISSANSAGISRLGFWTGSVGSFPYFCASGKSSPQNGAPRLATGLSTPGFSSYYPDFPRVVCLFGFCSIVFQGINILAYDYIMGNNINYVGIVFLDYYGDNLVRDIIALNGKTFGKCTLVQTSQGCTCCSTRGVCLACNTLQNYVYNSVNKICDAVSGYYLDAAYIPQNCTAAMIGCLQCSSATQCTLCDTFLNYQLVLGQCVAANGYYLDASSIPVKCNILGCYLCSSATVCTNCSTATNFVMDATGNCVCDTPSNFTFFAPAQICVCIAGKYLLPNGTCEDIPLCPANNSGCITCVSNVCTLCDSATGFTSNSPYCICQTSLYYDGIACQQCNISQPACAQCINDNLCVSCLQNFTLSQGQCVCQPQFYSFDSDTCLQCTAGCLSCTGPANCSMCNSTASFNLVSGLCICNKGMFVDVARYGQTCVPCGAMPGCTDCNMYGCIACDNILGFFLSSSAPECICNFGYYIDTVNDICAQCKMLGCLGCTAAATCTVCDNTTFYLELTNSTCLEICGDGVLYNLQCDDGNLFNGDGCSSLCTVEKDFTCSGGSASTPSACSYSGPVNMSLVSYIKDTTKNQVTIKVLLSPAIPIFNTVNYTQCFTPNFPFQSSTVNYQPSTGEITYTFDYDKSLNTDTNMQVAFTPPQTLQFYYTPRTSLPLPYTTDNNLALKAYPQQVYTMLPVMTYLCYALMALSCGGFVLGLISSRLMAVEMILVVQVAYMGLICLDKLQALMYPLILLWPVNGYNKLSIFNSSANSNLPTRIAVPGYTANFLANFNADLVVILLPFLAAILLYILFKAKQDKVWKIRAFKACKQWGISLLLFVQLHLCTSVIASMKYGTNQTYGIAIGAILSVLLILQTVLLVVRPNNFGDYKKMFQNNMHKNNFYVLVVIARFVISFGVPLFSDQIIGLAIGIAVLGLEMIIIGIFRPYKHNLRPILNNAVAILCLAAYLSYKVKIIDQTLWGTTYIPLILILVLIVCVIMNILLMIRHKFCNTEKIQKVKRDQYFEAMEESIENEAKKQMQDFYHDLSARKITTPLKQMGDISTSNMLKDIRNELKIFSAGANGNVETQMREYEQI